MNKTTMCINAVWSDEHQKNCVKISISNGESDTEFLIVPGKERNFVQLVVDATREAVKANEENVELVEPF